MPDKVSRWGLISNHRDQIEIDCSRDFGPCFGTPRGKIPRFGSHCPGHPRRARERKLTLPLALRDFILGSVRHGQGSNRRLGAKDFAGKVEGSVGDIAGSVRRISRVRSRAASAISPATQGRRRQAASARRQAQRKTCTARPRMPRAMQRMPPSAMPRTLMRTAAILSVTARKRLRRRCRTIRSVRC